jgi:dTDP-4-dehydrorhamnose reductase
MIAASSRAEFSLKRLSFFPGPALKEVVPITTPEYPTPARRPANSVLDCTMIAHHFGIRPRYWKESLEETIELIYGRGDK